MFSNSSLVIRADSNTQIGTGHVMRCIALAQAWQDRGGKITFLSHCESNKIKQRIQNEGFDFIPIEKPHPNPSDLEETLKCLSAIRNPQSAIRNWLALDGYHFTPDYQKTIRVCGYRLLVIDDTAHLDYYHADILVNQNINAPELNYSCNKDTIKLLGCNYVMLRREFLQYKGWKRKMPEKARKILVTMGGSDPDNVTLRVIKALNSLNDPDLEVKIVAGPANQNINSLEKELQLSAFDFELLSSVSNMPELMARADLVISAGGSTCWELAFLGLPTITLILAGNQQFLGENLNVKGVAVNLGWHQKVTTDKIVSTLQAMKMDKKARKEMSALGLKLVDGAGGARVVKSIIKKELTLRPAQEQDCELIWKWANDSSARSVSFSSKSISWNEHIEWFKSKLNNPRCFIYVAINRNEIPVGQVRVEEKVNEAVISVSVDKKFRGNGYGSIIIDLASQEFFQVSDARVIHAYVKQDNEASTRVFAKAGFKNIGVITISGQQAIHLAKHRDNLS